MLINITLTKNNFSMNAKKNFIKSGAFEIENCVLRNESFFLVGALWLSIFALIGTRDMPINGFISINQSGRKKTWHNVARCVNIRVF